MALVEDGTLFGSGQLDMGNSGLKVGVIHELGFTDALPLLRRVVDAFGPQRCMWESDSGGTAFVEPERDYRASIDVIRKHADFLSESDKEQVLFKTTEDFFFNR